mmetsp:Transcript_25441/g.37450  ORF Transcript_25441/g.37450 Transcript_25441/m.37450 type:complete len:442 (+) Transcript_25441:228-1553(+)|eukprot:CAMPEP_0195526404 /NCGR_PEP_ID=MMETSP0794_2-20130614/27453_1 /TAXON_ID=515487 /ORGANISM="Stephanopyxis turris, Strain CCMP 815" /LENGTH=441 /DNA_ID=CAMNT_0040657079 /DNA_START=214 /DNA_END=1539 /DNA_ORIENTATION=+
MNANKSSLLPIIIDGSFGEGGGQILRNAISFACILSLPIEIINIRANRSKPGLSAQHLTGLRLVSQLKDDASSSGGMVLSGDELRSTKVLYAMPSSCMEKDNNYHHHERKKSNDLLTENHFVGDIGTAGSVCLLLQAALPCALFRGSGCSLELRGGTNAEMAPQVDYLTDVFLPVAGTGFGFRSNVHYDILKRGYFPRGGGVMKFVVERPIFKLNPIRIVDRGNVQSVRIRVFYAGKVPRAIAQDMAKSAQEALETRLLQSQPQMKNGIECHIVHETNSVGSGSGILITATTSTGCILAGSALGKPRQSASDTGELAAFELVDALQYGGCVDKWLQDQFILYMALADGTSEVITGGITLHTKTAIMIAEKLTGASFEVERLMPKPKSEIGLHNGKVRESSNGEGGSVDDGTVKVAYAEEAYEDGRFLIRCHGISFVNPHFK